MILIALGANLPSRAGAPDETLRAALMELAGPDLEVERVSPFYRSPAWPDPRDPEYANAVALVRTSLAPDQLMARLHETETGFARHRSARNAPRTLDLDLIDYDGRVEDGPPTLPHPRLAERNFVLVPLRDVAPGWVDPRSRQTVEQLLATLAEPALPKW